MPRRRGLRPNPDYYKNGIRLACTRTGARNLPEVTIPFVFWYCDRHSLPTDGLMDIDIDSYDHDEYLIDWISANLKQPEWSRLYASFRELYERGEVSVNVRSETLFAAAYCAEKTGTDMGVFINTAIMRQCAEDVDGILSAMHIGEE